MSEAGQDTRALRFDIDTARLAHDAETARDWALDTLAACLDHIDALAAEREAAAGAGEGERFEHEPQAVGNVSGCRHCHRMEEFIGRDEECHVRLRRALDALRPSAALGESYRLAREAWGDPALHAGAIVRRSRAGDLYVHSWIVILGLSPNRADYVAEEATELAALQAAIAAAPRKGE